MIDPRDIPFSSHVQCNDCEHKYIDRKLDVIVCKAFPKKIPFAILDGEHDHHNPYPGDQGIRFKQKEEET